MCSFHNSKEFFGDSQAFKTSTISRFHLSMFAMILGTSTPNKVPLPPAEKVSRKDGLIIPLHFKSHLQALL